MNPKRVKKRDNSVQFTRNRVFEVAAQVFHRKGYDNTSMSDVASAAGLTKAGLYHHVSSKESLLFTVFFFSRRRRHTRCLSDWSSDVCSSDLQSMRRQRCRASTRSARACWRGTAGGASIGSSSGRRRRAACARAADQPPDSQAASDRKSVV